MKSSRICAFSFVIAALLLGCLAGCSRDPNVRKQKYLESGKRYMDKKEYREAVIQFSNALQVDRNFGDAHYQLAQAYMKLGAYSNAYAELLRTVDLQPQNEKANIDLGNLLLGDHQIGKARDYADTVLRINPKNADARALLANASAAEGKLDTAVEEMQDAIRLDGNRGQFFTTLGIIQARAQKYSEAEASLKKAVEVDSKSSAPLLALADFYQARQRLPEAEAAFKKAVAVEPNELRPRTVLVSFYLSQKRQSEAEQVARQTEKDLGETETAYRLPGDVYVQTGQLDKATAEFATQVKNHPKDITLKKSYADLLISQGRVEEANKIISEILDKNPKDSEALIFKAQLLLRENKVSDALPILESAVKNDPDNAVAHYQLASAALASGDSGRAEKELREAVRLRPALIEAQQKLVGIAAAKGDQNTVMSSTDTMMKVRPNSPYPYVMRATVEADRKQLDAAESDFQKAVSVAPREALGYVALGQWRIGQKKIGEAEKLFEQALAVEPGNLGALEGLLRVYALNKQPISKSVARVQSELAKTPNSSSLYTLAGRLAAQSNDLVGAQKLFQKAIELNKNNTDAIMLLGQVAKMQGATDAAINAWQEWAQREPKNVIPYMVIGSIQEDKDWQKAEASYRKALEIQPDFAPAANNLAYLMLEHNGNLDMALSLAQVARRGMPNSPYAADTLAWAYYQKGLYPSAIDLLERATKEVTNNAVFHFHLGLAYAKQSDPAQAQIHLEKALQLDPNFPQAEEARKTLRSLKS